MRTLLVIYYMAGEKVEIRGGGELNGAIFQNAATEATLQLLVKALSSKGGKSSGDEAMRLHRKSIDENIVAIDKTTDRQQTYNKILNESNTKVKAFGNEVSNAATKLVGGIFSTTLSLAASGLSAFTGFLTDSLDKWTDLSSVGASFNNNLIELRQTAAQSNLSIGEFSDLVRKNSTYLAAFGGTVTEGAKRIGDLSKNLRSGEIGENLFSMGYTISEINGGLGNYLELQTRLGRSELKDQKAMTNGSVEYLKQLDLLAKITGQNREEIAKSMQKQTQDLQINSITQRLNAEQLKDFSATLSIIDTKLPKVMQEGIKDLLDGRADTGAGRELQRSLPILAEYAKRMGKDGGGGVDKFLEALKASKPALEDLTERYGNLKGAISSLSDEDLSARIAFGESLSDVNTLMGLNFKEMKAEQERRHALTTGMNSLENAFSQIKNTIIDKLLGSGAFTRLSDAMGKMITQFTAPGGFADKIASFLDKLISGFDSDLTQKGLVSAIGGLFAKVAPILGDLAKGAMRMIVEGFSGASDRRANLESRRAQLTQAAGQSTLGVNDPRIRGQLAEINDELAKMDAANPFEDLKKSISGLFPILNPMQMIVDGLKFAWDNLGTTLAVLAGTGGVLYLLGPLLGTVGAGLSALVLPVAGVLAAFGLAAGGLGFMFNGVSAVIDSFVAGLRSIPEVLTKLSEIDGSNLKNVASAVSDMAGALASLAGGGLLTLISGNSIDDLAKSLKTFNTIDSTNLKNIVNAIGEVKTTIGSDFSTQAAGIDSFRTSITKLNRELKDLADRLDSLPNQSGGIFESIKNAVGLGGGGSTRGSSAPSISLPAGNSSMEELNTSMTQLLVVAREINQTNKDQLRVLKERPGQAV